MSWNSVLLPGLAARCFSSNVASSCSAWWLVSAAFCSSIGKLRSGISSNQLKQVSWKFGFGNFIGNCSISGSETLMSCREMVCCIFSMSTKRYTRSRRLIRFCSAFICWYHAICRSEFIDCYRCLIRSLISQVRTLFLGMGLTVWGPSWPVSTEFVRNWLTKSASVSVDASIYTK